MSNYKRRKGQSGQNEVFDLLRSNNLDVQSVDASGAIKREKGDIILRTKGLKYQIEVKREKTLPIAGLENRKADSDILIMRQNRDDWKVYMDFNLLIQLLVLVN